VSVPHITFTAAEVDEAKRQVIEQRNNAQRRGTVRINAWRDDWHKALLDSFLAEWAVADLMRVPRGVDLSGSSDGGTDLVTPGGESVARCAGRCAANPRFRLRRPALRV
jgi:hypothetical protein